MFLRAVCLLACLFPLSAFALPDVSEYDQIYSRVAPELRKALTERGLDFGAPLFIRVFKEEAELEAWVSDGREYQLFRVWRICDQGDDLGPKLREGDDQTPEGVYTLHRGSLHPGSDYHLAVNIGYPNEYDQSHRRTGSFIMIHGKCSSSGCIAMKDHRIEEIYTLIDGAFRHGQETVKVHIYPFRMSPANMARHSKSRWLAFWEELRAGYILFEQYRRPPRERIRNGRYIFSPPPVDCGAGTCVASNP